MPTQEFYSRTPGRRFDQVQRQAKADARKAGFYERQIELTAPGDVNLDPSKTMSLSGTGTSWDASYIIQSATFVFDQPQGANEYGGCVMTVDAAIDTSGNNAGGLTLSPLGPGEFGTPPSGVLDGGSLLSPTPMTPIPDGFAE